MLIDLENVSLAFRNGYKGVNNFTFAMDKGVYGLLGENGAGKTTLMRVMTTILKPTEGTVTLGGIKYTEKNYQEIQQKIGYLPQELNLYPNLTVNECLLYLGGLSNIEKKECQKRIDYFLEKTSLTQQRNKKIKHLSGGMTRRVGLIQALLNEPDFLIVDEPTTGLDPEERVRIRRLLVDFSQKRTVLFSTHVVEDLAATTNQLAVMKQGKLLYAGTVSQLLAQAKGKVWSCKTTAEEAVRLEQKYLVSSKFCADDGMHLKVISETQPEENAKLAEITLEDAYIYLNIKGNTA